jgi:hypothetical protein
MWFFCHHFTKVTVGVLRPIRCSLSVSQEGNKLCAEYVCPRVTARGWFSWVAAAGVTGLQWSPADWPHFCRNGADAEVAGSLSGGEASCTPEKLGQAQPLHSGRAGGVYALLENCGASCLKYNIKSAPLIRTLRKRSLAITQDTKKAWTGESLWGSQKGPFWAVHNWGKNG